MLSKNKRACTDTTQHTATYIYAPTFLYQHTHQDTNWRNMAQLQCGLNSLLCICPDPNTSTLDTISSIGSGGRHVASPARRGLLKLCCVCVGAAAQWMKRYGTLLRGLPARAPCLQAYEHMGVYMGVRICARMCVCVNACVCTCQCVHVSV